MYKVQLSQLCTKSAINVLHFSFSCFHKVSGCVLSWPVRLRLCIIIDAITQGCEIHSLCVMLVIVFSFAMLYENINYTSPATNYRIHRNVCAKCLELILFRLFLFYFVFWLAPFPCNDDGVMHKLWTGMLFGLLHFRSLIMLMVWYILIALPKNTCLDVSAASLRQRSFSTSFCHN